MARLLKSASSTLLATVPLIIAEMTDRFWRWHLIPAFGVAVFLLHWFYLFRPERRFEQVREPTLDWLFHSKFSTVARKLTKEQRLPFRVTIMQERGFLSRRLEVLYSFGMKRTDPDYRIVWKQGHGLCWKVFQSGKIGWFDREIHDSSEFNLTEQEEKSTEHVMAVLSLPIRKPGQREPCGVLNFDALSKEAVDDLRKGKEALRMHKGQSLVDLVTLISIYL